MVQANKNSMKFGENFEPTLINNTIYSSKNCRYFAFQIKRAGFVSKFLSTLKTKIVIT